MITNVQLLQGPRNKIILPLKEHFKYKEISEDNKEKSVENQDTNLENKVWLSRK